MSGVGRTFRSAVRAGLQARLLAAVIVPLLLSAPLFAQTDPQAPPTSRRPFRGLFGGAPQSDPTRVESVDLRVSFLGGYDDNLTSTTSGGGLGDPRLMESGSFGNPSVSLSYRRQRKDNSYFVGGRAGYRYFPTISELNAGDYGASAGFSVKPSRRTQLGANQDLSYQPYLSLFTVPVFAPAPGGGLVPSAIDYGFTTRPSITYSASASAAYDVARRSHVSAGYWFRGFDLTGSSDEGRQRQHTASAGFDQGLGRRVRLGARYLYEHGDGAYVGPPQLTISHGGEATFDYTRARPGRRQVAFGFSAGYSRIDTQTLAGGQRIDYRTTGSANFSVDVGRTWSAHASYRRGLRYVPGLAAPVFSDDVQAGAKGLIGRRTDLSFDMRYSNGEGYASGGGYDSTAGTAQLRWAMSRQAALTGSYIFTRYAYPAGGLLFPGLDSRFNRQAVRVGVDVWLPLYR